MPFFKKSEPTTVTTVTTTTTTHGLLPSLQNIMPQFPDPRVPLVPSMLLPDPRLRSPTTVPRTADMAAYLKRYCVHGQNHAIFDLDSLDRTIRSIGVVPDIEHRLPGDATPENFGMARRDRGTIEIKADLVMNPLFSAGITHMMDVWALGGSAVDRGGREDGADSKITDLTDQLLVKLQPLGHRSQDDVGAIVGALLDFINVAVGMRGNRRGGMLSLNPVIPIARQDRVRIETRGYGDRPLYVDIGGIEVREPR